MSDEHGHPEVLVPHTKGDFKRVSWVVMVCSAPLFVTAWRFLYPDAGDAPEEVARNAHAAYTFIFGGLLLLFTGIGIGIKDWRKAKA